MQKAALSKEISVAATNRFFIKNFFRIAWLLIKKNWAHSHNFKSIVELVAGCGGEIKKHFLHAPQNAIYKSPEYISKYIQVIIDDHIKLPLLTSLRSSGPFKFFNDETSDVTTTKEIAFYANFNYQGTIKEHFMNRTSSLYGTTMPSLVAIGLVVIEI